MNYGGAVGVSEEESWGGNGPGRLAGPTSFIIISVVMRLGHQRQVHPSNFNSLALGSALRSPVTTALAVTRPYRCSCIWSV